MNKFIEQRGIESNVLMMQDFGVPVGFRIATKSPDRIDGLVIMNGNAYEEGLNP